ncbi:MAG: hypothetical protein NUV57_01235 [archaeon]|nr:hypothetical protein [archaeon]
MASFDIGDKSSVIGRSMNDIEKYGDKATAYFGKSVMSSGEKPVLGRKILIDIAKPHVMLICGKRGGGKCLDGDTLITLEDGSLIKIKNLEQDTKKIMALNNNFKIQKAEKTNFYKRKVNKMLEITLASGKKIKLTPEHPLLTKKGWAQAKDIKLNTRIATQKKICEKQNIIENINSNQKQLQIKKQIQGDVHWDEIKEKKKLEGNFQVYDLTVPKFHNFVANDIIVHNSYSMAVLIEEFARQPIDIRKRLSVIVIDTVGIFWSLKLPTKQGIKELEKWDLKPEKTDVRVLVPKGKLDFYKKKEIPIDGAFTLRVSELETAEWMSLFKLSWKDPEAILLSRIVDEVKEKLGTLYGLDELITAAKNDNESEKNTRDGIAGRFRAAKTWGLFEKEGTKIKEIAKPATITIIDVSAYRQAVGMEGTRDVIVGLLGKRLFEERMLYRKEEEIRQTKGLTRESDLPIIWMMIDEAHMFMPKDEDSFALSVLLEWVRVGRQPGLSLLLATQRPNKLHPDAISQCDLFISHRMTAQPDIDAVAQLRPSYLHQDFDKYYQEMPRAKGYALVLDDQSEKLWLIKVRPRFSWDAGVTASAFKN